VGIFDRVRLAAAALTGRVVASSGWNWRSGTKPGVMFDGSKFSGSLIYPSKFDLDHEALRDRSRIAYWESSQARAIIGRLVDNVVGTGLALESRPVWALIGDQGMTEEQRHQRARDIEQRFDLWASSHEPDAAGKMTLYELQAFEFLNRLRDGETFPIMRYSGDAKRMSPLSIQFLLPEQVQDPMDRTHDLAAKTAGRRIVDGIEIDAMGRELAIYTPKDDGTRASTRIPVEGSTRRFVLHPIIADTMGAIRGTPLLAPLVHELQKITDYTVAEIEAAVINAVLAVWVKPGPDAAASRALAGIQKRGASESEANGGGSGPTTATFDKPGLIVQTLKANEEVQSFDTKRPNVNFGEFVRHITRSLSASVGIPIEVLEESFNANYSASRASLLLFWRKVEIERARSASQFLGPIFEAWFTEEVKAGRIQAPNFTESPVIRRAWLACSWNGDKQPSIDPLKEANADDVRIAQGATTRERVAMEYNGSDSMDNIKRLAIENAALAEANAPMEKAAAPNAAPAPAQQDDEDDDESEDQTTRGQP
jgi:lambda family phage portal protein